MLLFRYIFVPLKVETLCGIIGIWAKNSKGESEFEKMPAALKKLSHRGPDNQSIKTYSKVCLGHTRLSVIDPVASSNQPMTDQTGKYHLIYNGEIYNYKELRQSLEYEGFRFNTKSDTEVLLNLLISKGEKAVEKLNGCFAFVFYDEEQDQVIFARDRIGIKPLILYEDENKIILTSEMGSLYDFDIDSTINETPLNLYLRLTYIPAPTAILKKTFKILPGQMGVIDTEGLRLNRYYSAKRQPLKKIPFQMAADELKSRLTIAVKDRLVSDVPLGTFLSGGMDSSIISAIAKRHKDDLQTFSVGFEHPYFNELDYANMVANHIDSNHHVIMLGKKDFQENFHDFLNSIDEPFGDSSAFAMYLLSKETKKHVTVALSGDGADELFAGYRKHRAEFILRFMSTTRKSGFKFMSALLSKMKVSRSDKVGDFNRRLQKMVGGFNLNNEKRYFEWCCFLSEEEVFKVLKKNWRSETEWKGIQIEDMADFLIADQHMVLPNDMLKKVDQMSMAHGLEVRTPFLDHNVVELANSFPIEYKLDKKMGKILLKYAFESMLPKEVLYRSKKGFEIPLQDWLGDEITELLNSDLFERDFVEHQGIFEYDNISHLIKSVKSNSFGDKIYLIWSLIVFQNWYKRNYS